MYDAYKPTDSFLSISPAVCSGVEQGCHSSATLRPAPPMGLTGASTDPVLPTIQRAQEGMLLALHSGLKNNLMIRCLNLNKISPLSKTFFNFVNLQN